MSVVCNIKSTFHRDWNSIKQGYSVFLFTHWLPRHFERVQRVAYGLVSSLKSQHACTNLHNLSAQLLYSMHTKHPQLVSEIVHYCFLWLLIKPNPP